MLTGRTGVFPFHHVLISSLAIAIVLFCRFRSFIAFALRSLTRESQNRGERRSRSCRRVAYYLLTRPVAIVLLGCTSSTTLALSLYLTYLSHQPVPHSTSSAQVNPDLMKTFAALVNGSSFEVRAGYFGLCARDGSEPWICSSHSTSLAGLFQPYQDPLNLIWIQARFREGIVFSGLM